MMVIWKNFTNDCLSYGMAGNIWLTAHFTAQKDYGKDKKSTQTGQDRGKDPRPLPRKVSGDILAAVH